MFSALKQVWRQLIGALHDLIENNADAGRTGRQAVREIDGQIRRAEESITDIAAQHRLLVHDHDKAKDEAAKWDQIAQQAAGAGDVAKAREAVHKQVAAEERMADYAASVKRLTPMLQQLTQRLEELRRKKRDMEHKTSLLDARSKVADAESRAARILGNVGEGGGVDFEQLERNVDRKEAKAAALADMAHEKVAGNVDHTVAEHARRAAIASKLGALGINGVEPMRAIEVGGNNHA